MNRRGFLGLLAAAPAVAIAPDLAELLNPKRTIFLPPKGGWAANSLLTAEYIAREALKILEVQLSASVFINREYDRSFYEGSQWKEGQIINIRRPSRYEINHIKTGDKITIAGLLAR